MTLSNKEIHEKFWGNDINAIIEDLDSWEEQVTFLMEQSMLSLKEQVDYRVFIAERIYKVIQKQKSVIESFYNQTGDDNLLFWLSILMLEFERDTRYFSHILDYVKTHNDGQEILGVNVLIQGGIREVGEVIVDKLRELEFDDENFDRISFYFGSLNKLGIGIPLVAIEKAQEYNNGIKDEWRKLTF